MSGNSRNALIGLFVLGGMAALGILIVKFGETPRWMIGRGYLVNAWFSQGLGGVREGTEVKLAGLSIGRVMGLGLRDKQNPGAGVVAVMEIDEEYDIPLGWRAYVMQVLMGVPEINIRPPGAQLPPQIGPDAAPLAVEPTTKTVPRDGTGVIHGVVRNPLEAVIDPKLMATLEKTAAQIGELAQALTPAANAFTGLLEPRTIQEVEARAELTANLSTVIERLQEVLKHFDTVLGDAQTQMDIKETFANLRAASEEGKVALTQVKAFGESAQQAAEGAKAVLVEVNQTVGSVRGHVDELGPRLVENANRLAELLDNLNTVVRMVSEGKGTVGKLLGEPKLHEALMLTVQRLGEAAFELTALVKQWQREGLLSSTK